LLDNIFIQNHSVAHMNPDRLKQVIKIISQVHCICPEHIIKHVLC